MGNSALKKRYSYIDNMKFAACILVVIGHFIMSMTANKLMSDGFAVNYFINTLYSFHVPVFFVCSGFLYQKSNRVHSFKDWKTSVGRKLLDLGVPYLVFSTVTVMLKKMFENDVTSKSGGLLDTLFLNPTAPYWYLYVLMFFFLIIPCMKSKKGALILLIVSAAVKIALAIIYTAGFAPEDKIGAVFNSYIVYSIARMFFYSLKRLFFFALGMYLAFADEGKIKKYAKFVAPPAIIAALAYSCFVYPGKQYYNETELTVLGALFLVFIIFAAVAFSPEWLNRISYKTADFFMPVFVLHTIFSAGIRIVLLKIGTDNLAVHIIGGIIGGFVLPAVTYLICKKLTPLMFFFYPTRTIKIMRQKNEQNKKSV